MIHCNFVQHSRRNYTLCCIAPFFVTIILFILVIKAKQTTIYDIKSRLLTLLSSSLSLSTSSFLVPLTGNPRLRNSNFNSSTPHNLLPGGLMFFTNSGVNDSNATDSNSERLVTMRVDTLDLNKLSREV